MNPSETQYRIAVCDDSPQDRQRVTDMTQQILLRSRFACQIAAFDCAGDLLDAIRSGKEFDIMLLDVMMEGMNGMELAAQLRQLKQSCAIVFISSNREMAMHGYEVAALRYLAKPVQEDKLEEALMHCLHCSITTKEILLPTEQGHHRISVRDIQYVEAYERGTRFFLQDRMLPSRLQLGQAQALLQNSTFLFCHRAYIVNLSAVVSIRKYDFVLQSGKLVPISRDRYPEIYRSFVKYVTR